MLSQLRGWPTGTQMWKTARLPSLLESQESPVFRRLPRHTVVRASSHSARLAIPTTEVGGESAPLCLVLRPLQAPFNPMSAWPRGNRMGSGPCVINVAGHDSKTFRAWGRMAAEDPTLPYLPTTSWPLPRPLPNALLPQSYVHFGWASFMSRLTPIASPLQKTMSQVFFDMTKDGAPMGRITFQLYDE